MKCSRAPCLRMHVLTLVSRALTLVTRVSNNAYVAPDSSILYQASNPIDWGGGGGGGGGSPLHGQVVIEQALLLRGHHKWQACCCGCSLKPGRTGAP